MSSSLRVLLVDDDEDFSEILGDFLVRCGFTVMACTSLTHCMEAFFRGAFNVALIDGSVRGRDGCEAVEALRLADPDVAIVVLSGRADPARREQAFASGANAYMTKPCSLAEIRAIIHDAAESRRVARRLHREASTRATAGVGLVSKLS